MVLPQSQSITGVRCCFECPAATSANAPEHVPFCIDNDLLLICLVKPDAKQVMTLAEVMRSVTKERGVTEVKLVDHSLRAKMKA